MKRDRIIEAAKYAHGKHWKDTHDESVGDKQARAATRYWQESVRSESVKDEAPVSEGLNERFDVVDFSTATAYEMKVSGKNPHQEFYRDICKVVVYNQYHKRKKLKRLVFITQQVGAAKLSKGLGVAIRTALSKYNLQVEVVGIRES